MIDEIKAIQYPAFLGFIVKLHRTCTIRVSNYQIHIQGSRTDYHWKLATIMRKKYVLTFIIIIKSLLCGDALAHVLWYHKVTELSNYTNLYDDSCFEYLSIFFFNSL